MFTGIIEAIGNVQKVGKNSLSISTSFARNLKLGQSIAVNGACLTVVEYNRQNFTVDLLEETKKVTNLGSLKKGDFVNLERAMKVDGRFDGHIVQAHIEAVGTILSLRGEAQRRRSNLVKNQEDSGLFRRFAPRNDSIMTVQVPRLLLKYMILKGVVILDGIALTLTKVDDKKAEIEVAIIPYTWENTNLRKRKVGDMVNIETDIIAKYLDRLL